MLQAGHAGSNAAARAQASWAISDAPLHKTSTVAGHLCKGCLGNFCLLAWPLLVGPHPSIAKDAARLQGLCKDKHGACRQPCANLLARIFSFSQRTCSLSSGWLLHGGFQRGDGFSAGASSERVLHGDLTQMCRLPDTHQLAEYFDH